MKNKNIKKIIISALFIALCIVLPFFTGQIKELGNILLPMHLPIFLCSYICGPLYGMIVGIISPLLRSFILGTPKLIPSAISMSIELMAYGFLFGFLYNTIFKKENIKSLYISLIISMILGRILWGIATFFIYKIIGMNLTLSLFFSAEFITSFPGIVLQLVIIPLIIKMLKKINY